MKHIYELLLLAGVSGAIYLYAFAFDAFSETELVRLSYLWIVALIFGSHGLIASELNEVVATTEASTLKEALPLWRKLPERSFFSKLAGLFQFSFIPTLALAGGRQPFLIALMAVLFWIAGLVFFFEAVFPAL